MRAIMKQEFKNALKYPGCFAATADIWKDPYRCNSYLGMTAHICTVENGAIARKSFVFHIGVLNDTVKSNQVIYQEKVSVFQQFDIPESVVNKNVKWCTDRGGNVQIAFETGDSIRIDCLAHIINNFVSEICEKSEQARRIIGYASSLVTYMKKSGLNCKLKKTLKSFVEVRWNTAFYTIDSIIENYDDISKLLEAKEAALNEHTYVRKLTCMDMNLLKEMNDFPKVFTTITIDIQGKC